VAAESLPFDGVLPTSELELIVFSDKECGAECQYWRPNTVSHRESGLLASQVLFES
jgi:hypothetical protein